MRGAEGSEFEGGSGGMLPQEILKFLDNYNAYSCILARKQKNIKC